MLLKSSRLTTSLCLTPLSTDIVSESFRAVSPMLYCWTDSLLYYERAPGCPGIVVLGIVRHARLNQMPIF